MDGQMASLGVPVRGVSPLDPTGTSARNAPVRDGSASLDLDPTALLQAPAQPASKFVAVDPMTGSPADQWAATARLLAGTHRVRLGRERRGGIEYRTGDECRLTDRLPAKPAAVRIYGDDGTCATICLDLDSARVGADAIATEAKALTKWLNECGARVVEDVSPNGGRHIYIPLAQRLGLLDAREIVEALARRFPTIDAAPHRSARSGCIRTPGSRHKSGGHQQLVTTLAGALDILRRPNPSDVVEAMRIRLAPQIAAWHATQIRQGLPLDAPALPDQEHTGTMRALSSAITRIAREGIYDTNRYGSPSEARMAVIAAAARAGWALADVVVRLEDGRWPGLAAMYATNRPQATKRRERISADWHNAQAFIARTPPRSGHSHVLSSNTSLLKPLAGGTRPAFRQAPDAYLEHQFIRTWTTAVLAYETHRLLGVGLKIRWLVRALAEAGHKRATRYFSFGVRSLAIATGSDHTTVAAQLKVLTDLGWIDLIESAHGRDADTYALTLPADVQAADLRWHSGTIHAKRPAFRDLGDVPALVFEALELQRATTITELVTVVGCSRSSISDAVDTLCAHGLVERTASGLIPRPEQLARVAEDLGVTEAIANQLATYTTHRRIWHAWLARHDENTADTITERDLYDGERDEYWLPPPDDFTWTMAELLVA